MSVLREVTILVSNIKCGNYFAKSYPDPDFDNDNKWEMYLTPVYKVFIIGTTINHKIVIKEWKALRFVPYWNDPKDICPLHKQKGFAIAGLHSLPKKLVTYYNVNYTVHNTESRFKGGIQIVGSFLIHAGPESIIEWRWGGAGCVEIIGRFDKFKDDIKELSGSTKPNEDDAILELVKKKKLYVQIDHVLPPKIKDVGEFDTINKIYNFNDYNSRIR